MPDDRHSPMIALKCKKGELEALTETAPAVTDKLTPVVELLNTVRDNPSGQIVRALLDCAVSLAVRGQSLWIDPHWLAVDHPLRNHPQGVFGLLDEWIEDHLALLEPSVDVPMLIPVLRPSSSDADVANVRLLQEHQPREIAIRLPKPRRDDLFDLVTWLRRVTAQAGVTAADVHIIIDEQYVHEVHERLTAEDIAVIRRIRHEFMPASIALLSGCTPDGKKNYTTRLTARTDAQLWSVVASSAGDAAAPLRYGDYGVVPPIPKQDGGGRQPHPWLRYTAASQTLCLAKRIQPDPAGEIPDDARAETFTEVADMLTGRPEYAGSEYSWGDRQLAQCGSSGTRRTGSSSAWLAMATSHHLAHLAVSSRSHVDSPESFTGARTGGMW